MHSMCAVVGIWGLPVYLSKVANSSLLNKKSKELLEHNGLNMAALLTKSSSFTEKEIK